MNSRVRHAETKHKATIKYIGNIKNAEYFGIEYDNAVGKYDGTFENTHYFTCKSNHGGFVKKVKLIDGLDLLQAI